MYPKRAIAIPPHTLNTLTRLVRLRVEARRIGRGRKMGTVARALFQTASRQRLHVDAGGCVEEVVGFAQRGFSVAVDLVVVVGVVGVGVVGGAAAVVFAGGAGEHCREVALE